MKRVMVLVISVTWATFSLYGCSSNHLQEAQSSSSNASISNYNLEMIDAALKKHPDFPKLKPNETKKIVINKNGKKVNVTYSSETSTKAVGATVTTRTDGSTTWTEGSDATYFITLRKVWKTDQGNDESYWKYDYHPKNNQLILIDSKNNANK